MRRKTASSFIPCTSRTSSDGASEFALFLLEGDGGLTRGRRVAIGTLPQRGGLFGEALEGTVDKGAEIPAVDVLVRGFAGGVVAAGEDFGDVVDVEGIEVFEDVEGVFEGEGEVVGRVDDEAALGICGETIHVGHGADDGEDLTDLVLGEPGLLEGFADVAGALALPGDVAEPGGGVVEGADLEARIEGGGDEGVATAKACA